MEEEKESTSLIVIEKADAMQVFTNGGALTDVVNKIIDLALSEIHDPDTAIGRAGIKALAYKIRRSKTYMDGVGKELVDGLKELPKTIDAHRKAAREALDTLYDDVRKPLTDWENEQARIKAEEAAKVRAEQEHKAAVQASITALTQTPLNFIGRSHADILSALEHIQDHQPGSDTFGERLEEAMTAWGEAVEKLTTMAETAEAIEHQSRVDRERRVAEEATAKARDDADRKVLDAKLQAEKSDRERQDAERRAKEAEEAAAREREGSVQREEAARLEATRLERERADAATRAQAAEEAKRAADIDHRKSINNNAVNDLVTHAGLTIQQGREVVKAIAGCKISNIAIKY